MRHSETTVTIDVDASDNSQYNDLPQFVNLRGTVEVQTSTPNEDKREITLLFADQLERAIEQTVSNLNSACYENGKRVEDPQETIERFEQYSSDLLDDPDTIEYKGPAKEFEGFLAGGTEENHD